MEFTFDMFVTAYNQLSFQLYKADMENDNKKFERLSYVMLDMCKEYSEFNKKLNVNYLVVTYNF